MYTAEKICRILDCNIEDIVEFIDDATKKSYHTIKRDNFNL